MSGFCGGIIKLGTCEQNDKVGVELHQAEFKLGIAEPGSHRFCYSGLGLQLNLNLIFNSNKKFLKAGAGNLSGAWQLTRNQKSKIINH